MQNHFLVTFIFNLAERNFHVKMWDWIILYLAILIFKMLYY